MFRTYKSPSLEEGEPADHIHALCSLSKTLLVDDVKKASSKWIKTKGGLFTKFHWQSGYGAFSVSPSQVADGRCRPRAMPWAFEDCPFRAWVRDQSTWVLGT
ncbi:MAG: transposase [Acidobacteriia bacterium]|nr:transposase [Terriglobia bacterium]